MAEDNAILIARPESDRVPVVQLVGIALACAGAGIGLVYGLATPPGSSDAWTPAGASSTDAADEFSTQSDISSARATEAEDDEAALSPGRVTGSADERGPAGSGASIPSRPSLRARNDAQHEWWALMGARAEAPRELTPDPPLHPEAVRAKRRGSHPQLTAAAATPGSQNGDVRDKPLSQRRLQRGAVTYLRCDGTVRRNKRSNPCPRDRRLEAGVWKALKDLPQCQVADPGTGRAQLKLTVRRRTAPQIEVAAPDTGSGLNLRAVNKCTSPDLVRLKSRLRATHAIITFAFGLN